MRKFGNGPTRIDRLSGLHRKQHSKDSLRRPGITTKRIPIEREQVDVGRGGSRGHLECNYRKAQLPHPHIARKNGSLDQQVVSQIGR